MPWFYAGPEAKQIGPVTLEELHERRISGAVSPETYVIEYTGQPDATWKPYRELFPNGPPQLPLPPLPTAAVSQPPPSPLAHPVSSTTTSTRHAVFIPSARSAPHHSDAKDNLWCIWGFWLGLCSMPLLFVCGLGLVVAPIALIACIVGLVQVQHQHSQSGRGLALAGLLLSILTLFLAVVLIIWAMPYAVKAFQQAQAEQTSDNSN